MKKNQNKAGPPEKYPIISIVPIFNGWCVQMLLPNGRLQWVPFAGSFREALNRAAHWKPEKGETT